MRIAHPHTERTNAILHQAARPVLRYRATRPDPMKTGFFARLLRSPKRRSLVSTVPGWGPVARSGGAQMSLHREMR